MSDVVEPEQAEQPEPAAVKPPPMSLAAAVRQLNELPGAEQEAALRQLGELPIGKTKYPIRGVMASVYDTLANRVQDDD
jgi:hypothetical protein